MDHKRQIIAVGARFVATILLALAAACGGRPSPSAPNPTPDPEPLVGFTLTGDPGSGQGATWTYRALAAGTAFDLQGILLRPQGTGPFPAVIISHGAGGNALGYSRAIARTMVGWGLVCIATNYTHAGNAPIGSPGTANDAGASAANVLRARRLVEILGALGYVDTSRLALHGHSMGAFVTAATAAAHPDLFRAASHTAGGVRPDAFPGPAPSESQVSSIRTPYQMHHGDRDFVVPLISAQLFAAALAGRAVEYELLVYPGADHDDVSMSAAVLDRVREWYRRYGVL
jgi:dienelactone hydrolase